MKKFTHYLVLLAVVVVLKVINLVFSEGMKEAAKNNLAVTAGLLVVEAMYLAILYSQHRKKAENAANEALRVASEPGKSESDWAPLLYESKKPWKGNTFIIVAGIGVFSSLLASLVNVFLLTDGQNVSDQLWGSYTAPVIALVLYLGWNHLQESRECLEFQESLKAANEGHWVPSSEEPESSKEDNTVKGRVREFIQELPKEILDAAEDSLNRRL